MTFIPRESTNHPARMLFVSDYLVDLSLFSFNETSQVHDPAIVIEIRKHKALDAWLLNYKL